jgi:hypothetical protein
MCIATNMLLAYSETDSIILYLRWVAHSEMTSFSFMKVYIL